MKKLLLVVVFILATMIVTALVPYPFLSQTVGMTNTQATKINDFHESEVKAVILSQPKLLDLSFNDINSLLSSGSDEKYELINLENNQTYSFERIGGTGHCDIVFENAYPETLDWSKVAVLVKLSDNAYVPASLCEYKHGYENHFCLHFLGSKTHGTNKIDPTHQKIVKKAAKLGKAYLKNL